MSCENMSRAVPVRMWGGVGSLGNQGNGGFLLYHGQQFLRLFPEPQDSGVGGTPASL